VVKGAQPRTGRYCPAAKQYLGIKKSIRILLLSYCSIHIQLYEATVISMVKRENAYRLILVAKPYPVIKKYPKKYPDAAPQLKIQCQKD
jgi:hypothetical protein